MATDFTVVLFQRQHFDTSRASSTPSSLTSLLPGRQRRSPSSVRTSGRVKPQSQFAFSRVRAAR
jgi:hypothetical protein